MTLVRGPGCSCWHLGEACQQPSVGAGPRSRPHRPNCVTLARASGGVCVELGGHPSPCSANTCLSGDSLSISASWAVTEPVQWRLFSAGPAAGGTWDSEPHSPALHVSGLGCSQVRLEGPPNCEEDESLSPKSGVQQADRTQSCYPGVR